MNSNSGGLIGLLISLGAASAAGFFAMAALMVLGDWTLLQALFAAAVIFAVLGLLLAVVFSRPLTGPVVPGSAGKGVVAPTQPSLPPRPAAPKPAAPKPAAPVAKAEAPEPAPVAPEPSAPANDGAGTRPARLDGPRDGGEADDLKKIKGVGPKMETLLNSLGFYHFDQIAGWTADEVAWVDQNLEGFKGRVTRDDWVEQAKHLAAGGDTEFSRKVDKGDVY
jgi:predicted flap endonuclease-1-like 5' DNA nuclease